MSTSKTITKLERQRRELLDQLLATQEMIRGSFSNGHRRCGKVNCWCAQGQGHPINRINFSDEGQSRTKVISAEDALWAEQMTQSYKRFRKNRQALRVLEKKLNAALDDYEQRIIKRTAKQKKYVT